MACADRTLRDATALAAALLTAGAAFAQVTPSGPGGAVARSTWTLAQLQQAFLQADGDGDGLLTRAEAQQLAILPAPFEDLDANKDGLLSPAEHAGGAAAARS